MKLSNEQQSEILRQYNDGMSVSDIARNVLGRVGRRSTVSAFLKRGSNMVQDSTPFIIKGHSNPARILFIDIETSPCVAYHWKRWDENINQEQVIQESFILSFSAKFLDKEEIIYDYVTYDEVIRRDDKRVISHIYDVLNSADIVVAHNGRRFDKKKINTRLLYNGFAPTTPYRLFDTLVSAKANFAFPSNSLDNICAYLGLNRKLHHDGFKLWRGYMEGDPSCIQKMVDYNIQDVIILQEIYLKLRSWDKSHPNVSVYAEYDKDICICCGSLDIEEMEGEIATTNISGFPVYECKVCGKKMRGRKNILEKPIYTNIS